MLSKTKFLNLQTFLAFSVFSLLSLSLSIRYSILKSNNLENEFFVSTRAVHLLILSPHRKNQRKYIFFPDFIIFNFFGFSSLFFQQIPGEETSRVHNSCMKLWSLFFHRWQHGEREDWKKMRNVVGGNWILSKRLPSYRWSNKTRREPFQKWKVTARDRDHANSNNTIQFK